MSRDAIHYKGMLAVARRHFDAELHVRALVLVREDLPHDVKEGAEARHRDVEAELGRHYSGQPGNLLRVRQNVLAVARSPAHSSNQLDELWMEAVNPARVSRALAGIDDRGIHLLTRLADDLLDSAGMDAAVGDELFE